METLLSQTTTHHPHLSTHDKMDFAFRKFSGSKTKDVHDWADDTKLLLEVASTTMDARQVKLHLYLQLDGRAKSFY
ncbi:hypothetical protein PTSG_12182 [Salpingoeca rosetta]|uniref:Uncharacterized protein n=1 Tax=Salpingoeca rosetta (strain ATCC 50818 / BSB-021) TaxID=946362 RepID=F2U8R6_SALR5|nr:uncharacterized protein PTSG_12182 [Salpingoeca rosetta]EGD72774.1 hypothetical protein PTSG_12182 [Salpingoeca rosetta]|eukprot:XP_004994597.1 hypothetical protein PTSG_12182 [Salpingoeca rosetta]